MKDAVLIAIHPQYCEMIANGYKTAELRKTRPKLETPFKCYIYCTIRPPYLVYGDVFDGGSFVDKYCLTHGYSKSDADRIWGTMNGKVIGEFVCDNIKSITPDSFVVKEDAESALLGSCLTPKQAKEYAGWKPGTWLSECKDLYSWHISDLVIYDEPKELSEFVTEGDCDCMNCAKCAWFDKGDSTAEIEDDCNLAYIAVYRDVSLKPIFRPPQSWCYVSNLNP